MSHLQMWYKYNELKHNGECQIDLNQINDLKKKSQQYDFDTAIRQWFCLTPVQINQLTHQQLKHWINQAKLMIRLKKYKTSPVTKILIIIRCSDNKCWLKLAKYYLFLYPSDH